MNKEKELRKSSDYGWNHPIDPAWERETYDGIKGFPPEWVPEPRMREFCVDRGCLFFEVEQGKATYLEIKSRFDWMKDDKDASVRMLLFPGERKDYDECLSFLVWLFKTVSLDEEKGLTLLAGEKAVKGKKFSSGGAAKKGKEYEPKASIRKICAKIKSHKFDDVLDSLRGEDSEIAEQCKDWYESTSDPIGVLFTGVDDKGEVISYLPRGVLPDNPETITFKRLRDILTEIK